LKILITPDHNITAASSRLETKLISIFQSLRKDPTNESAWKNIQDALQDSIVYFAISAYNSGCADVNVRPIMSSLIKLRLDSEKRAKFVASHMQAWTLMNLSLQAAESKKEKKKRLLGKERAKTVADNEMRVAFYSGKLKGWSQNKQAKKAWHVSSEHDQDDSCDDDEEDGPIPIDEPFTSGDMNPPAHINCNCSLWLHI